MLENSYHKILTILFPPNKKIQEQEVLLNKITHITLILSHNQSQSFLDRKLFIFYFFCYSLFQKCFSALRQPKQYLFAFSMFLVMRSLSI